MSHEGLLREALRAHADQAPPEGGLLAAVHDRSRRRRRRRLVVGSAMAVLLVGGAAPLLVGDLTRGPEPEVALVRPAQQPAATATLPPGATTLVPAGELELPDFPLTPTWIPPGLSDAHYEYTDFNPWSDAESDGVLATYQLGLTYFGPEGDIRRLTVSVRDQDSRMELDKLIQISQDVDEDEPGTGPQPLTEQPVTVQGLDAVLLSSDAQAVVSWQFEPQRWVTIMGEGVEDVLRFAEGVADQPMPARPPVTFELLPDGVVPQYAGPHGLQLVPDEFPTGDGTHLVEVRVLRGGPGTPIGCPLSVGPTDLEVTGNTECPLPRSPVHVGEHTGELFGSEMVVVYLPDEVILQVAAVGSVALSQEDLVHLAAGIQLTPDARPADR